MSNETYLPAKQKKAHKYPRVPQENVHSGRPQDDPAQTPQRTQAPHPRLKFLKSQRVLKRWEYQSMQKGATLFKGEVLFIAYKRPNIDAPKLGITVTKRFGNAVKRNQFKRRVREAFRVMQHEWPRNLSMVVKPKKECKGATFAEIQNDLQRLAGELTQSTAKASR